MNRDRAPGASSQQGDIALLAYQREALRDVRMHVLTRSRVPATALPPRRTGFAVRVHNRRGPGQSVSDTDQNRVKSLPWTLLFGIVLLHHPPSKPDVQIVHFLKGTVEVATKVSPDCPIHLLLTFKIAYVMSLKEAFKHQVNNVRGIETWIHDPQCVDAIKKPGIKTIRYLSFAYLVFLHIIDIQRKTL